MSLQDVDKPCDAVLQQVSIEEILEEQRLQQQAKQETEKVKMQVLKDRGLSIPKADNLEEYWRRSLHLCRTENFIGWIWVWESTELLFFFMGVRLHHTRPAYCSVLYELNLNHLKKKNHVMAPF